MDFGIFCKTFYLVFLVLIAVGPGFLTIANIAMTRGLKTSAVAVCGCFLGDCIYMVLGALCAKEIVAAIPQSLSMALSIVAICLLLYLAYSFYKVDIKTLKAREFSSLIICVAGWVPTHAVIRVADTFRNLPVVLWGLCGWRENGRLVTTADQAGTTAIRPALEAMGYRLFHLPYIQLHFLLLLTALLFLPFELV